MITMKSLNTRNWIGRCAAAVYGSITALALMVSSPETFAQALPAVAQSPLSVAGNVPGNVALALSVEFPTAVSVAHQGEFAAGTRYVGYFNPSACYEYHVGSSTDDIANTGNDVSYFNPVGATTSDYKCTGTGMTDKWSGSFLNWLTMQAVDPFRQALTGGYRRVDTSTTTILERAWSPNGGGAGQGDDRNFPAIPCPNVDTLTGGNCNTGASLSADLRKRRRSPSSSDIADHTPLPYSSLKASVRQRGNEFLVTRTGTLTSSNPAPAIPNSGTHTASTASFADATIYRFYARVRVCVSGYMENNCRQYSSAWKPEGLLQDYSRRMRFSAFGYLNDPTDDARDGGVLRARQKFVGPEVITPGSAPTANANKEWDETTGVMFTNPDSADASSTASTWGVTVANSGVINYINKFGQEQHTYKRRDPVGELYYTALRYLKNQGNVLNWMPSTSDANKTRLIDGFPVIQTWSDPVQYQCQNNFILGIGDTNSSWDRNVPGPTNDSTISHSPGSTNFAGASGKPAAVTADTTVDADAKRTRVRVLNNNLSGASGDASDLIAGLAFHAATEDIRPGIANMTSQPRGQNVQTYWLDVLEFGAYLANNQYYLATKFGGLNIPEGTSFNPDTAPYGSVQDSWWTTNGETTPDGRKRPDNYFTVDNPQAMISALERTFARISARGGGSGSSLAANSARIDTSTRTFQAQFTSAWSGELRSYVVNADGSLSATPEWTASTTSSLAPANWASRAIYTHDPANNTLVTFSWANLTSAQQSAMISSDVVDYIRGNQAKEETQAGGTFRTRVNGLLGDLVNSTPVYVAAPNPSLYNSSMTFSGASTYQAFATAQASRTGLLWVGANDGMLHAFNASTGQEVFAFVPKTSIANGLATFASPNYAHKYFVDGDIAVADIYDTGTSSWKTILVGTLGRGGPGVFALDVTNPTAAGISLLWDKDASDIAGLGRNIGQPVIAQTADGVWKVLIGNGPGGAGGIAQLVAIDVLTGTTTTISAGGAGSNGLSAVLARDTDADRFVDTVYAGDLTGRLLKFTGLGGTPAVTTIFSAVDPSSVAQPITAAPLVGKDPATGITWVFFGTGQYLTSTDPSTTQTQTWYGVQDNGTVPTRADLVQRSVLNEGTASGVTLRTISVASAGDMTGKHGWYLDLPTSRERMVVPNQFLGGALLGTSRIPDTSNVCEPSGSGFIMAINPFTGARLTQTFFDISGDGLFNDSDMLNVSGTLTIASGFGLDSSPNKPISVDNVLLISTDRGDRRTIRVQGSSVDARRLTWREIRN